MNITTDPNVLELIYQHFAYLRDHPLELRGAWLDEAESLGVLKNGDFLGFLIAYEIETEDSRSADHFPFLSPEENRDIRFYRHLRPVIAWPQPIINVAFDFDKGEGTILGTEKVEVMLREAGNSQLWWGGEIGIIWEAYLNRNLLAGASHDVLLTQLWDHCERYLKDLGATRLVTPAWDPVYDRDWYQQWLSLRGYRLAEGYPAMWKQ